MQFYDRIDYFRKAGDFFAVFFFIGAFIYLYNSTIKFNYKNLIMIILLIAGICDTIFTINALKLHGFFLGKYNDINKN